MPCSPGSHREGQKMPLLLAEPGWCFREQQRCHPVQCRSWRPCGDTRYDPTHDFDLTMWHHIAEWAHVPRGTRPPDPGHVLVPKATQHTVRGWGSRKGMDEPWCF